MLNTISWDNGNYINLIPYTEKKRRAIIQYYKPRRK
jgi:hypothetical protein